MTDQANREKTKQIGGDDDGSGVAAGSSGDKTAKGRGWKDLPLDVKIMIVIGVGGLLVTVLTFILDITDRFGGNPGTTPVALAPEPEATWTPTPAPVVEIVRINYAPTTDQSNEYVELRNNGSEALPLLGWRLEDKDNHGFDFPEFDFLPGASVKVWTCKGENGPSDLFWQRDSPVWNNDRPDTATLIDGSGIIIATRTYEP